MIRTEGIIPALVTPFDSAGDVDEEALRRLIQKILGNGCHGIFCLGNNGEFFDLT